MLYRSDFAIQYSNFKAIPVNRNAFTVTISKNTEKKVINRFSLAYTLKSLSYLSSVFGMSYIKYSKTGINRVNKINKLYCLAIIILYITLFVVINPIKWQQIETDLPLSVISKTSAVAQIVEITHNIFVVTFYNSKLYLSLIKTIDAIDDHFRMTKKVFIKRSIFAIVLTVAPFLLFSFKYLLKQIKPWTIISSFSFTFEILQGVNCLFFLIVIYSRFLYFNKILLKKTGIMSSPKELIFKDNLFAKAINKMLSEPVHIELDNGCCWFELMQIYDKISDCIYLFNRIYGSQIFLMFNSWLLSTILLICRFISPTVKYTGFLKADLYYYFLLNLRPMFVTGMSEKLIHERRKTLMIIEHNLIYSDLNPEYRKQIEVMLNLLETRETQLSANVGPVTLHAMATFTGLILSYTILIIQKFYLKYI